jgi:hypothetical protein
MPKSSVVDEDYRYHLGFNDTQCFPVSTGHPQGFLVALLGRRQSAPTGFATSNRRQALVILLCGGDKRTQSRDIRKATEIAENLED